MHEIRAMVPGVGCERLCELCSMFFAMALVGLTEDGAETPPDAIETALIAETAAALSPSATAWNVSIGDGMEQRSIILSCSHTAAPI